MFTTLLLLTLLNSCAELSVQKVSLDAKTVHALKYGIKGKGQRASRSVRFLQCVKELNFEGLKQSLIVGACEAAMGSIND
jgi:hypothetical protein